MSADQAVNWAQSERHARRVASERDARAKSRAVVIAGDKSRPDVVLRAVEAAHLIVLKTFP